MFRRKIVVTLNKLMFCEEILAAFPGGSIVGLSNTFFQTIVDCNGFIRGMLPVTFIFQDVSNQLPRGH